MLLLVGSRARLRARRAGDLRAQPRERPVHVRERDLVDPDASSSAIGSAPAVDRARPRVVRRPPRSRRRGRSPTSATCSASPLTRPIAAPTAFATSACSGRWTARCAGEVVGDQDAAAADDRRPARRRARASSGRARRRRAGPPRRGRPARSDRRAPPRRPSRPAGGDRRVGQRRRSSPPNTSASVVSRWPDARRCPSAPSRRSAFRRPTRDRDDVGHPEVRPDAAEVDADRRLPREPLRDRADVGARPADVDHDRVGEPGQRRRASDRVRRAAADREDRERARAVEPHHRAVVLGQERRRRQPPLDERAG